MKKDKKTDKAFVTTILIAVGIALFVVLSIILYDPIIALVQLNDVKKFNTKEEIINVVYTEPLVTGETVFSDKQTVLDGEDAQRASAKVNELLNNIKYKRTTTGNTVEWTKNIVLYNDIDTRTIYLGENCIYIRKGNAIIEYTVDDAHMEAYQGFLKQFE